MPPTTQLIRFGCISFVALLFILHFLASTTSTTYSSHVSLTAAKEKLGLTSSSGRGDEWFGGRRVSGKIGGALLSSTTTSEKEVQKQGRERVNAVFVTLARNRDLWELLSSMRGIEDRFNTRLGLNYDWIFLNEEPFSEEALGDGFPQGINVTLAQEKINAMGKLPIPYAGSIPYRKMCRYNSVYFYEHELLASYDYYWRVEPNVKFFCNLDYDPFRLMKEQNKKYGFVVSLYEYRETVETLWKTTKEWMEKFPQYLAKPNMLDWISNDGGNSYNLCHYWSNFEIGALDFYRSDAYRSYVKYLDDSGGFFYERWGDAPVHSVAAALLLKPEEMHYFADIGYRHEPFQHCPVASISNACACSTKTEENFEFHGYSCTPRWKEVTGYKTPSPFNWGE